MMLRIAQWSVLGVSDLNMRPVLASEIETFEARFDYAINGTLRTINVLDPKTILIRISVQDKARSFDWIDLELEISDVSDARLIEDAKLKYVDMSEGMTMLYENGEIIIAVGEYDYLDAALNAPLFVRGGALKYQENTFSA
jgi:hypothetical protein